MRRLALACLVVVTALVVVTGHLSAQAAQRLFATLSANIPMGVSTPLTCTASGSGCLLDVTVAGGSLPIAAAQITAASGTGLAVTGNGLVQTGTYKIAVTSPAFVCAAVTCDVTIGTLPANTWLTNVVMSLDTVYACASTCTTTTLSFVLGKGAGGAEYIASFDADASTAIVGDQDAEMGTSNARASAVQGGTFTTASQAVVLRLTSGTGNIGTGTVTNLSQGTVTIWLTTLRLP